MLADIAMIAVIGLYLRWVIYTYRKNLKLYKEQIKLEKTKIRLQIKTEKEQEKRRVKQNKIKTFRRHKGVLYLDDYRHFSEPQKIV